MALLRRASSSWLEMYELLFCTPVTVVGWQCGPNGKLVPPPMNFYYSCDLKSTFIIDQKKSGPGQEPEIVNWLNINRNHSPLLEGRELIDLQYNPKHNSIDNIGGMINLVPPSICLHWSCGCEINIYRRSDKLGCWIGAGNCKLVQHGPESISGLFNYNIPEYHDEC